MDTQPLTLTDKPKKGWYRPNEGRIITGLCMATALYTNINVWVIRIIYILGALSSGGTLIGVYFLISLTIPSEDKAKAKLVEQAQATPNEA